MSLDHEVVTKNGEKFLSVSVKNDCGVRYRVTISKLYYRQYETLDELPLEFDLEVGETFSREFSFHQDAWSASNGGMPNEVTVAYSGTSPNSEFESDTTNPPSLTWGWSEIGPDADKVFFDDSRSFLLRPVEMQITSIVENGKEQLSSPLELRVEPGASVQIPRISRKKKPTIIYIARMLPNKRWSDPETFQVE